MSDIKPKNPEAPSTRKQLRYLYFLEYQLGKRELKTWDGFATKYEGINCGKASELIAQNKVELSAKQVAKPKTKVKGVPCTLNGKSGTFHPIR